MSTNHKPWIDLADKITSLELENLTSKSLIDLLEDARDALRDPGIMYEDDVHCRDEDDHRQVIEDAEAESNPASDALRTYGAHRPTCLAAMLGAGSKLHGSCDCGWNDIATDLEQSNRID